MEPKMDLYEYTTRTAVDKVVNCNFCFEDLAVANSTWLKFHFAGKGTTKNAGCPNPDAIPADVKSYCVDAVSRYGKRRPAVEQQPPLAPGATSTPSPTPGATPPSLETVIGRIDVLEMDCGQRHDQLVGICSRLEDKIENIDLILFELSKMMKGFLAKEDVVGDKE